MAKQYDLNDPYDLDIMRAQYEIISEVQWQEYINYTQLPENKMSFNYDERGCLFRMAKQAGKYHKPADKDIRWGLGIVEKIDKMILQAKTNEEARKAMQQNNKTKAYNKLLNTFPFAP